MCSKKSLMSFFKNGINKAFETRKGFLFYKCFFPFITVIFQKIMIT